MLIHTTTFNHQFSFRNSSYRKLYYFWCGFLCSSVIFKEKGNVKGLNTGATLWCSAAIGVFVGANELILSTITTIILVIANIISRSIAPKVYPLNTVYTENRHSFCINITCKESEEFSIRSYLVNDTKQEKFYLISLNSTDISHNNVHIKAEYLCFNKQPIIAVEKLISNCLKMIKSLLLNGSLYKTKY